jgi:alanine dehydrogenase
MKRGAVIVDVAVDQCGCIETTRETTHTDPVYINHGVVHYAVGNMPGAVPHTSTYALTNVTLPFQIEVARHGALGAARTNSALAHGLNTHHGHVTYEAVATALSLPFVESLVALIQ